MKSDQNKNNFTIERLYFGFYTQGLDQAVIKLLQDPEIKIYIEDIVSKIPPTIVVGTMIKNRLLADATQLNNMSQIVFNVILCSFMEQSWKKSCDQNTLLQDALKQVQETFNPKLDPKLVNVEQISSKILEKLKADNNANNFLYYISNPTLYSVPDPAPVDDSIRTTMNKIKKKVAKVVNNNDMINNQNIFIIMTTICLGRSQQGQPANLFDTLFDKLALNELTQYPPQYIITLTQKNIEPQVDDKQVLPTQNSTSNISSTGIVNNTEQENYLYDKFVKLANTTKDKIKSNIINIKEELEKDLKEILKYINDTQQNTDHKINHRAQFNYFIQNILNDNKTIEDKEILIALQSTTLAILKDYLNTEDSNINKTEIFNLLCNSDSADAWYVLVSLNPTNLRSIVNLDQIKLLTTKVTHQNTKLECEITILREVIKKPSENKEEHLNKKYSSAIEKYIEKCVKYEILSLIEQKRLALNTNKKNLAALQSSIIQHMQNPDDNLNTNCKNRLEKLFSGLFNM